jgi:hypothetical protein
VVADQYYYKLSLAAELSLAVAFASCMRALLWLASSLHFEFQTASAFRSVTQRSPPLPGSHCKATPGGALARATHTPVCLLALPLFSSLQSATTARAPPGLGLLLVLCSWRTAPSSARCGVPFLSGCCCCCPWYWRRREENMGGSGKWVKSLIGLKKPDREDCKVRPLASPCSSFLEIRF